MSTFNFGGLINRMANIQRWSLMKNSSSENLKEHSFDVAVIVWILCQIHNLYSTEPVRTEHLVLTALFHDVPEIITGDMPTPVKYGSDAMRQAYSSIEKQSIEQIASTLPLELQSSFYSHFAVQEKQKTLLKAADKIAALIKCVEEQNSGNKDFCSAENQLRQSIDTIDLPEVKIFMERFFPSYGKDLDSLFEKTEGAYLL